MRCIILADEPCWEVLFEDKEAFVEIINTGSSKEFCQISGDAFFDLRDEAWEPFNSLNQSDKPYFIAGVAGTLKAHHCPLNVIRMNTWPGALKRQALECVADTSIQQNAAVVLTSLRKNVEWLPDIPGMIMPRVLSMIINEAWFTWGDGVSSKEEIDTAMQLGTNYPMGPFAWGEVIGLNKVCRLLSTLSKDNERYLIAPSLLKEVGL